MPLTKYGSKNLAQGQLQGGVSASSPSGILQSGQGALFPTNAECPFWAKIEKFDTALNGYRVLKREIVKVTGRSGDTLSWTRGAGSCPFDYKATTQTATPAAFDSGDTVTQIFTAEHINEIQTDLEKKAYSYDGVLQGSWWPTWTRIGTFTGYQSSRIFLEFLGGSWFEANNDATGSVQMAMLTIGNEQHIKNLSGYIRNIFGTSFAVTNLRVVRITGTTWDIFAYHQVYSNNVMVRVSISGGTFTPIFDNLGWPNVNAPAGIYDIPFQSTWFDINGLTANTTLNANDSFAIYDSANTTNRKITWDNLTKEIPKKLGTSSISTAADNQYGWTSASVAVPRWGLVTVNPSYSYAGLNCTIQWSSDNTNWVNIGGISVGGWYYSAAAVAIVPPWYTRATSSSTGYTFYKTLAVQVF